MKKFLATFLSVLLACSIIFSFGCNGGDPTFGGNYKTATESEVYTFILTTPTAILNYDGLEVDYEYSYTENYASNSIYSSLQEKEDFTFNLTSDITDQGFRASIKSQSSYYRNGKLVDGTPVLDSDFEIANAYVKDNTIYLQETDDDDSEKVKFDKNVQLFISELFGGYNLQLNFSCYSYFATYAGKGTSYYMEQTEEATKIKMVISNFSTYGSVINLNTIFVFDANKEQVACQISVNVKTETSQKSMKTTIKQWQGEITAPTDLESYQQTNL